MDRRKFLTTATVATAAPLLTSSSRAADHDQYLANLIAMRKLTGLSLDDLECWFDGVDLTKVVENIQNNPPKKWNATQTRAAILGFKAGEVFGHGGACPLTGYVERQIHLRVDKEAAKHSLRHFKHTKEKYPSLMDLA